MSQLPLFSDTLLSFSLLMAGAEMYLPTALEYLSLKNAFLFSLLQIDDISNKCNLLDKKYLL